MDNFLLQAVVDEVAPHVMGQRVGKIYQPSETDLVIDFRLSHAKSLIISTDSDRLGIYLGHRPVNESISRESVLPAFAARLRKSLGSARLIRIEKLGDDRVVDLDFQTANENGDPIVRQLVVSLIGRSADAYLVESGSILASMRGRAVPGTSYHPPAPVNDRLDPFELPQQAWLNLIEAAQGSVATAAAKLLGFTPTYCHELEFLANERGPEAALHLLLRCLNDRPSDARIYSTVSLADVDIAPGLEKSELILASTTLHHLEHLVVTRFESISEAAESCYGLQKRRRAFIERRQVLLSRLGAQLKKQRSLREKLTQELAGCGRADHYQRLGDILLANLRDAVKSGDSFVVTNYFEPGEPQVSISAARALDALTAATQYFRLARKARHGVVAITARLSIVDETLVKLEFALATATQATSPAALDGLPLASSPQIRNKRSVENSSERKALAERVSGVRRYRSSDGFEILVGRTERDNDNLTLKVAKSFDLWFHAADYPGSHVVLRNPLRKAMAITSIKEAAQLAAKFSQAKNDSKVAVNYCERKFVSKPRGFAPGQVRLASFKTILVEPREAGERIL